MSAPTHSRTQGRPGKALRPSAHAWLCLGIRGFCGGGRRHQRFLQREPKTGTVLLTALSKCSAEELRW